MRAYSFQEAPQTAQRDKTRTKLEPVSDRRRQQLHPQARPGTPTCIAPPIQSSLLANAKARENLAQQIVCCKAPGQIRERLLGQTQLLRLQLQRTHMRRSATQGCCRIAQCLKMALTREKGTFRGRLPTNATQDRPTQQIYPSPRLR